MIFVDTSVWVAFFRGRDAGLAQKFRALLDDEEVGLAAPVRVELLAGASLAEQSRLKRLLSAFATFRPSDGTWNGVEAWIERATRAGHRFAAVDLLIAALAAEQKSPIWSLDADFKRMEKLGFVRCFKATS